MGKCSIIVGEPQKVVGSVPSWGATVVFLSHYLTLIASVKCPSVKIDLLYVKTYHVQVALVKSIC